MWRERKPLRQWEPGFGGPWKLDIIRDQALLRQRRDRLGVPPEQIGLAAWCHELHLQVDELARERGMTLLLMGGQGASLRLASAVQRSSADNDYIVSATADEVDGLMNGLLEKLRPYGGHHLHFTGEPIPAPRDSPLPMRSWRVVVPRLLAIGRVAVKLEFHLEPELPPHDEVEHEVWTAGAPLLARVPKLPFQIALKALTLPNPPIGIAPERSDARPRQVYDLDHLYPLVESDEAWVEIDEWLRARHGYECEVKRLAGLTPDQTYDEIDSFLEAWAGGGGWDDIRTFEGSQVFPGAAVSADGWRARAARLRTALRFTRDRDLDGWRAMADGEPKQVFAQIDYWT